MTTSPATASSTGGGGGGGGSGSRWCPTPEQVMLLEGMYRGGLKTPTATQIQQITARLSVYGKIQGKNVFYWFQNHKARDRQKLRKKLMALYQQHRLFPAHLDHHYPFLPLHQVSGLEDSLSKSKQKMNNWKLDLPFDQTTSKLMCDCPLMSMMMVDPNHGTTPYCTRVPPKTLQLFPVNATDLQEPDQSTSTQP